LDTETGLYYFHARYHDPRTSTFLNIDPLTDDYPKISGYAYCNLNPIKYIDPDGCSTHTDIDGNVLAVYDDKDLGVYRHESWNVNNYSSKNTSAGGEKMGETWTALGFADFDVYEKSGEVVVGKGAKIDLNSNWATDKVNGIVSRNPSLAEYQSKAGEGGVWDLKAHTPNGSKYYGSNLYGKYASARDAGNFAAGMVSVKSIVPTGIVDMGFGAYNMTGNSKLGTGIITSVVGVATVFVPPLGIGAGYLIGRYGEDKLSRAGIVAGQNYQRNKK